MLSTSRSKSASLDRVELPPRHHAPVAEHADFARDGHRGQRVVAGDHDRQDAGGLAGAHGGGGLRPRRIHDADEAQQRHPPLGVLDRVACAFRATASTRSPAAAISCSTDRSVLDVLVSPARSSPSPRRTRSQLASTCSKAPFEIGDRRRRAVRCSVVIWRRSEVNGNLAPCGAARRRPPRGRVRPSWPRRQAPPPSGRLRSATVPRARPHWASDASDAARSSSSDGRRTADRPVRPARTRRPARSRCPTRRCAARPRKSRRTVISFLVSVPVLSEQITDVLPSVSTTGRRRTSALRFTMRRTPMASEMVTTAGSASGHDRDGQGDAEDQHVDGGQAAHQPGDDHERDDHERGPAENPAQAVEVLLQRRRAGFHRLDQLGDAPELGATCRWPRPPSRRGPRRPACPRRPC